LFPAKNSEGLSKTITFQLTGVTTASIWGLLNDSVGMKQVSMHHKGLSQIDLGSNPEGSPNKLLHEIEQEKT
jgi:hypothetical protein